MAKIQYGAKPDIFEYGHKSTQQHTRAHNNTKMEDWPNRLAKNGGSTQTVFSLVFAFFFFFFLSKSENSKIGRSRNWGGFEQVRFYPL